MSTIIEARKVDLAVATAPAREAASGNVVPVLILAVAVVVTLFPLLWMITTAFTPNEDVFRKSIVLWPDRPTLDNFPHAFRLHPVARWLINSLVVAVAITAGKLALSAPAAFAFAFLRFPAREWWFGLVVGTMTVPYVITLIPTYLAVVQVGWYNTLAGVIVPSLGFCGFAIFFLRQSFRVLPIELFEAAAIDGAGPWRMLFSIALPNVMPAVASIAILSFLSAWNLYLWPHLVLDDSVMKTLSIGLKLFSTNQEQLQQWGPLMATAMIGIAPVLLIFVAGQRFVMSAFLHSGIK
jgi:ABC-type glycerol-3-phosphate transport system permease component